VRLAWPFKSQIDDVRNGEEHRCSRGDACPDFLCVGAQKAGTSWLYRQLEPHPDFWMPPVKELHYLDNLNRARRFHPRRLRYPFLVRLDRLTPANQSRSIAPSNKQEALLVLAFLILRGT
jgi:hypothetical protein